MKQNLQDLITLTKPRLNVLAVYTAWAGYLMGRSGPLDGPHLIYTLLGAACVAAGCGALNQWWELVEDGRMERTKGRPLPAKRLSPPGALWLGLALSAVGIALLLIQVNGTAAVLGSAAVLSYIVFYTPLKKVTPLCTIVGAMPGSLPPLIGYIAAHGQADWRGATLFGILFLWQVPHFLAIGRIHRSDYIRARFAMFCVQDPVGRVTGLVAAAYAAALLPLSLVPAFLGMSGAVFMVSALALGTGFIAFSVLLAWRKNPVYARGLFVYSVLYLPLLFLVMVLDKF